ncbi:biotin-dependent carboxyltransferase [Halopseudomonas nanhaiensis]|uniref:5-oxoprolinase subunit C family protein n=1 Tax=Halopseudomonas nanhaiensis TaxID=2830842 RepID=UPI001CBF3DF0|nr:biotin-dependent carboxyltransferase family protein [Halopseudomonas nanhaiensis]UAW98458.1 biotin-dependent carboxyltransferase [Halopseudomonas nanhaiensis]
MMLVVEQTLGLAQLQDLGRFGVRHLGVTQGGALDWVAMRWANQSLGNPPDASVLEMPFGGVTLRFEADTVAALAGADLDALLDDEPVQPWRAMSISAGQRLQLRAPRNGVRGYLAVPGGFDLEAVLGSQSTVVREGLGGPDGRGGVLRRGDRLAFSGAARPIAAGTPLPQARRDRGMLTLTPTGGAIASLYTGFCGSAVPGAIADSPYSQPAVLEMLLGSQYSDFAGASLFAAFNQPWRIDTRADRMGVRLSGPALRYTGPALISEGIPLGAIQLPPDGQPIILLNDRQTIGGYPRLGALTPLAVARLAQCAPGETVYLRPTTGGRARDRHLAALYRLEAEGKHP